MQNKKIQLGIIGLGRMGITHYSIINSHPLVSIIAITEPSKLISSFFTKYANVIRYKNYRDLLSNSDIDAVIVCTPPHLHFEIIKYAASKKVHVFCEKPFATNVNQSKILVDLFNEKKIVGQVGYVYRYNDIFLKSKEMIDDNVIGDILYFKSQILSATIVRKDKNSSWRSKKNEGGGALYEMGAHAIDLINFLIGPPEKVSGTNMVKVFSKNVEDIVNTTFLYDNGICGDLYINWSDITYRKPINKIEIIGSNGKMIIDQYSLKVFLNKECAEYSLHEGWNNIYITDVFESVPFYVRGNEFTKQLYSFINTINNDKSTLCSFRDGLLCHQVIEKIKDNYN